MHTPSPRSYEACRKSAMSKLSAEELQALEDHFHDLSSEKTDEIETDLMIEVGSQIRRALVGRHRIFCKLDEDRAYWDDHQQDFRDFSSNLAHRPEVIAAALAIRLVEAWEWTIVEAWSYLYRHAALLDIGADDFPEWCADQDPEGSRAFVTAAAAPASPNAEHRNA